MRASLIFLFVILMSDQSQCQAEEVPQSGFDFNYEYEYNRGAEDEQGPEHEPGPDILGLIQQTALGKEISDKISESVDSINQYAKDVGSKAQSMFDDLGRTAGREAIRFESEIYKHAERQANDTLQEIQNNAIAAVQNVHGRLTQSAGDMRKMTESLIGSVAQSLQTHLVVFWESLTKGNETHPLFQ